MTCLDFSGHIQNLAVPKLTGVLSDLLDTSAYMSGCFYVTTERPYPCLVNKYRLSQEHGLKAFQVSFHHLLTRA